MNIRCAFCQTPYALGRNEMLAGLQKLESENLTHYDAHCPRCRRVTQIPRQKLELAFPNWKEALSEAVSEAPGVPAVPEKQASKAGASAEKAGMSAPPSKLGAEMPGKKTPRKRTSKK